MEDLLNQSPDETTVTAIRILCMSVGPCFISQTRRSKGKYGQMCFKSQLFSTREVFSFPCLYWDITTSHASPIGSLSSSGADCHFYLPIDNHASCPEPTLPGDPCKADENRKTIPSLSASISYTSMVAY